MSQFRFLILALALVATPRLSQLTSLNLSRDLVRLGIASTNLIPNQPMLDAGPLWTRAIQYAKANGVREVTVDPGAYYFLSLQFSDRHVSLAQTNNLTIDFQGSDLFLARSQHIGLALSQCTNTVLQNFTIDFLELPFTQLRVLSANAAQRTVEFEVLPGWFHPSAFNVPKNPSGLEEAVYAFIFRDGSPAPGLTRMKLQRPFVGSSFTIVNENVPWGTAEVLARIQPGDTAVLTARGAGPPVFADKCDGLTLRNIKVFSSGVVGLSVSNSQRTLIERVYVMPKPGTDRLISTNADGITVSQPGDGTTIRLCRAIRTLDDGFSPHSLVYGTVQSRVNSRRLQIQRQHTIGFPNGVPVTFQARDGQVLGSAIVVSQTPAPTQAPTFQQTVVVDFDRDLPELPVGAVFYSSDPSQRGSNTMLERSTVQNQVFARGITLWGLMNSTIRGNYVLNSHMAAILGTHRLMSEDWMSPPLENVTLVNNVIDGAITYGWGVLAKMAAIELLGQQSNSQPMLVSPHKNIQLSNNFIAESARSAIRIENVTGGAATNNVLLNPNTNPLIDGYQQDTFPSYQNEFRMPMVIKTSQAIMTANNNVEKSPARISITDGVSRRLVAYAPGGQVLLSAANIGTLSDPTVTLTDADGSTFSLAIQTKTTDSLKVQLPAAALGGAVITVMSGGTVLRGTLFLDALENVPLL
jgi:hypothetical protein